MIGMSICDYVHYIQKLSTLVTSIQHSPDLLLQLETRLSDARLPNYTSRLKAEALAEAPWSLHAT